MGNYCGSRSLRGRRQRYRRAGAVVWRPWGSAEATRSSFPPTHSLRRHGGGRGRRDAGVYRCRSVNPTHDRRRGRGGAHAADGCGHSGAPVRPASRHGRHQPGGVRRRHRRHRGRCPGPRRQLEGQAGRHLRARWLLQLLSGQEPRRFRRCRRGGHAGFALAERIRSLGNYGRKGSPLSPRDGRAPTAVWTASRRRSYRSS